jgi:hypothetical protein
MYDERIEHENESPANLGTLSTSVDQFPEIKTNDLGQFAGEALDRSDQHANEAGLYLAEAKRRVQRDRVFTWPVWLAENCSIAKTRANELIRVATGAILIEDLRKQTAARGEKHQQKKITMAVETSNANEKKATDPTPADKPDEPAPSDNEVIGPPPADAPQVTATMVEPPIIPAIAPVEMTPDHIEAEIARISSELYWLMEGAQVENQAASEAIVAALWVYKGALLAAWDPPPHGDHADEPETPDDQGDGGMPAPERGAGTAAWLAKSDAEMKARLSEQAAADAQWEKKASEDAAASRAKKAARAEKKAEKAPAPEPDYEADVGAWRPGDTGAGEGQTRRWAKVDADKVAKRKKDRLAADVRAADAIAKAEEATARAARKAARDAARVSEEAERMDRKATRDAAAHAKLMDRFENVYLGGRVKIAESDQAAYDLWSDKRWKEGQAAYVEVQKKDAEYVAAEKLKAAEKYPLVTLTFAPL